MYVTLAGGLLDRGLRSAADLRLRPRRRWRRDHLGAGAADARGGRLSRLRPRARPACPPGLARRARRRAAARRHRGAGGARQYRDAVRQRRSSPRRSRAMGISAVAGYAVIGRIMPLAFGAIFALAGSIGPILGPEPRRRAPRPGAPRHRRRDDLHHRLLRRDVRRARAAARADRAGLRRIRRRRRADPLFLHLCGAVVDRASAGCSSPTPAFNNLGFPTWSTVFNWGRATVGTMPFVWIGATQFGAAGVIAGQALGAVVFGIGAVIVCFRVVGRLAARPISPHPEEVPVAPPIPPFSSGQGRDRARLRGPDDGIAIPKTDEQHEKRPPEGPAGAEVPDLRGDEEVRSRLGRRGRIGPAKLSSSGRSAASPAALSLAAGTIDGASNTFGGSPIEVRRRLMRRSCARLTRIAVGSRHTGSE